MIKSVAMSAQSIKRVKRPRAVSALETKLKIIADFENRAVIRNVESDLRCYKEVLNGIKKSESNQFYIRRI
jgi:hypothetical protein